MQNKLLNTLKKALDSYGHIYGPPLEHSYLFVYIIISVICLEVFSVHYMMLITFVLFLVAVFVEYSVLLMYKDILLRENSQITNYDVQIFHDNVTKYYGNSIINHIEILSFILTEVYASNPSNALNNIIIICIIIPIAFTAFIIKSEKYEKLLINRIIY